MCFKKEEVMKSLKKQFKLKFFKDFLNYGIIENVIVLKKLKNMSKK